MKTVLPRPPAQPDAAFAQWLDRVYLLLSEQFDQDKISLLGSKISVDMRTAGTTTIFTTRADKTTRITHVAVRNPSASMAGGTSFSFTNWRQTVDLSSLTTASTDYIVIDGNNAKYTEISESTAFALTVTTGTTAPCTATIDVFGYIT
jgi:hypothetical protein